MKKFWMLILTLCMIVFPLSACGGEGSERENHDANPPKILVAYFSCTGNTEGVAEMIAEITGGELYEIVPKEPYTQEDLNYGDSTTRATMEQHDPDARPQIEGSVSDMGAFEVVYLGYPIWWGEAPKIVYTFLERYDFSGKTIIPFCTSASSGIGNSDDHLHALASGATWLAGERFSGGTTQSAIRPWLSGLTY